jgi:hypothetical protein
MGRIPVFCLLAGAATMRQDRADMDAGNEFGTTPRPGCGCAAGSRHDRIGAGAKPRCPLEYPSILSSSVCSARPWARVQSEHVLLANGKADRA